MPDEINPPNVYDSLAIGYDEAMAADPQNRETRDAVKKKVLTLCTRDEVLLDFGGGTGLDLDWTSAYFRTVIFYEPSAAMRAIAMRRASVLRNITFAGGNSVKITAGQWGTSPDVVLANFGVLNSIVGIRDFFCGMYQSTASNARIFALLLKKAPRSRWSLKKLIDFFRIRFFEKPFILNGKSHRPVIHTHSGLRKACSGYFFIEEHFHVRNSAFSLYVFSKERPASVATGRL
jgi:hypothetical protein